MRLSPSVKEKFNYGILIFKKIYEQRASAERVFSGLVAIAMQKPTVIGLKATQNHCTIAHIIALLVALTSHRMGYEDEIRYLKSFLPKFALYTIFVMP